MNIKRRRKSLAAGTAVVVTTLLMTPPLSSLPSLSSLSLMPFASSVASADQLTDAQHQKSSLEGQQSATKSKVHALSSREASLKSQLGAMEGQLSTLQAQIDRTQAEIAKRNQQISQLKQKIQETQQKLNAQYQLLQQRLRSMYENGNTSYLEVLFSATSFSDLLDRVQLLSTIAQQDHLMLVQIQQSKHKLDKQKADLVTEQTVQKRVYQGLVAKRQEQQAKQAQAQQLLSQVHDAKLQAEADLQQENAALSTLNSTIATLEAQAGAYHGAASGWTWPVPSSHVISSGYGYRTFDHSFHPGIDIAAPYGAPMVAATAGRVLMAGPASGYGYWIVIQSANNLLEVYGHMPGSSIRVHAGQDVSEGQQIAVVGSEGNSTGPHLHFEIATGINASGFPVPTNPLQYVSP